MYRRPCCALPQLSPGASDSISVFPSLKWDNNSKTHTVGVPKVHLLTSAGCREAGALGEQASLAAMMVRRPRPRVLPVSGMNYPAPAPPAPPGQDILPIP